MTRRARRAVAALALLVAGAAPRLGAQSSGAGADPVIDSIIIIPLNVFEPAGETPPALARIGNALHITTQSAVIRRLLLVDVGAPLDSARLVESARALRALGVFRAVRMDTLRVGDRLALRVITADGWSTSPQFNISSSAGSTTWSAALVERNFLGTATLVSLAYGRNPDRSSLDLQFASPGLLVRRAPLYFLYSDLSDGEVLSWSYGVPFYRTAARWSFGTDGDVAHTRVLGFRAGLLDTATERHFLRFGIQGGLALSATATRYLRLWAGAAWRREDYTDTLTTTRAPYSAFGTVGAGIEAARVRYGVFERVNGFGRHDDVDLSAVLRLGVWAAPRAWGYPGSRAGLGPTFFGQLAAVWPGGLARVRFRGHGVAGSSGLDSGTVSASFDLVNQRLVGQTMILHVEGAAQRRPRTGIVFDPWISQNGPRAFPAHAFSGTRLVYAMLEDRVTLADELMGVLGLGLAPYIEYGGAWFAGQEAARLGGDVGLALRLGSPRSVRGDVTEFDISYRFGDGFTGSPWALTFRKSYSIR